MKRFRNVILFSVICITALFWNTVQFALVGSALQLLSAIPGSGDTSALEEAGLRPVSVDEVLDAQLGLLRDQISVAERAALRTALSVALPLRQSRLEQNDPEPGYVEQSIYDWLNGRYEDYTVERLGGDTYGWGYENPEPQILAEFSVDGSTGELTDLRAGGLRRRNGMDDPKLDEYKEIWEDVRGILPEDALRDFTTYIVWTDGPDETLAFVQPADDTGDQWEIAIDPEDVDDGDLFLETILHEYCHYLTLNDEQADYEGKRDALVYNETYLTSMRDSYLNAFYRRFWSMTLDDRLTDMDSYNFYLRHELDFVSGYASTDPAEDIAESFAYFVNWDEFDEPQSVAEEKVLFFYEYDELVALRAAVRANLGWESTEPKGKLNKLYE